MKTLFRRRRKSVLIPAHACCEGIAGTSLERLSQKQREVLQLVTESHGNNEIASILGDSIKTTENHRSELMTTLDVHDISGLLREAIRVVLIDTTT